VGGDFVVQIHKQSESGVLTLAFAEQADTFASRQQKIQSGNDIYFLKIML